MKFSYVITVNFTTIVNAQPATTIADQEGEKFRFDRSSRSSRTPYVLTHTYTHTHMHTRSFVRMPAIDSKNSSRGKTNHHKALRDRCSVAETEYRGGSIDNSRSLIPNSFEVNCTRSKVSFDRHVSSCRSRDVQRSRLSKVREIQRRPVSLAPERKSALCSRLESARMRQLNVARSLRTTAASRRDV